MLISYPTRSVFLVPLESAIETQRAALVSGAPITVRLSPQGYEASVKVLTALSNTDAFWADCEYSDPTRFPARIRAATLALYRQGCFGSYLITHKMGLLTIRELF